MNSPRDEKLVKSKMIMARSELAGLLESLAERVRVGDLSLGNGEQAVQMLLPDRFHVELEAEDEGSRSGTRIKRELELEISWLVDDEGSPRDDDTGPITIS